MTLRPGVRQVSHRVPADIDSSGTSNAGLMHGASDRVIECLVPRAPASALGAPVTSRWPGSTTPNTSLGPAASGELRTERCSTTFGTVGLSRIADAIARSCPGAALNDR
jgi:hypothetical protein